MIQEISSEHLSSAMEQQVLSTCGSSLDTLQSLASIRSLITNSHTSNSIISSILKTLTHSLQHNPDSLTRHHKLKLLTDLAANRVHLCPDILNSLLFYLFLFAESSNANAESHRVVVDSLISLSSILEIDGNLPSPLIDDAFLVSMCFGPSVSARLWLLRNAEKLGARTHVMLTVFLGFTTDPYPYVREAALDGLTRLARYGAVFKDYNVVEGCYCRAVELLQDNEDIVRCAAIRVVSEWGQMLVHVANEEEDKREWPNVVFIQLCAMVRDMSVEVRIEAFNTLGRIQIVSEEILLQTLSKKVLWNGKEKKFAPRCIAGRFEVSASGAAGVFVHGLEDEFFEVRKSACTSLRVLTILSAEFAGHSLNLFTDMLNDDAMVVRLEALVALHYMTTFECLKLQEMHMHMFIGTLRDGSAVVRSTARKVFKSAKLPNLQLFRLSINGLLENLELHPQDEAEIFSVLFHMGRNHGKFAARVVQDVLPKIEPFSEGKLSLDSARVAAFLILSISAPISGDQDGCSIPPRLFSYAVTLLGRLSDSVKDVLDQSTLLAYMVQCSRSSSSSVIEFEGRDTLLVIDNILNCSSVEDTYHARIPSLQVDTGLLRSCKSNITTSPTESHQEDNEVLKSLSLILAKASDAWLLVQTNRTDEAVMTLRSCQEEASVFSIAMPECASTLAFTLHFIKVMKLLSKVWEQIVWKVRSNEIVGLGILLGELDDRLRELRCRFVGFSKEEELNILELSLVSCILKLSKVEMSYHRVTLKKLSAIISHIEHILMEGTVEPSNFIVEVKLICKEVGSLDGDSYNPFLFMKLVNLFTLRRFTLCRVRHIHAELDVLDNDSENPLSFVAGLPVAIPLEIIIHNVTSEIKLWLRIALNEVSAQFVSLDSGMLGGCSEGKKFRFDAPFYRTPKSCSFSLSVCIGMECWFEELQFRQSRGGPKHALTYICPVKEVYFCLAQKNL